MPDAFKLGILVLTPKEDKGAVRGIGLLDVIHKIISQIINLQMNEKIKFCELVHGFCKNRGTYTAISEAKIHTQIATCKSTPVYQIYLDLQKAYVLID